MEKKLESAQRKMSFKFGAGGAKNEKAASVSTFASRGDERVSVTKHNAEALGDTAGQ